MEITKYHFHIYFTPDELSKAEGLVEKLKSFEELGIGRVFNRPIGPHPIGSCQITVPGGYFETALKWFLANRDGLTLFIHPLSGDDYTDHTEHVMWLGEPQKLIIDFFGKG